MQISERRNYQAGIEFPFGGIKDWLISIIVSLKPEGVADVVFIDECSDEERRKLEEFAKVLPSPDRFGGKLV